MTSYRIVNDSTIIEGTKLDTTGKPVIAVYVQVVNNSTGQSLGTTTTNKNGYWTITILTSLIISGRHTIRFVGSGVIQKPEPLGGWEEIDLLSSDLVTEARFPIEAADVDSLLRVQQTANLDGSRTWQFAVGINATRIVFKNNSNTTLTNVALTNIYTSTDEHTLTSTVTTPIAGLSMFTGGTAYAGAPFNIAPSGIQVIQLVGSSIISDAYKVRLTGTNLNDTNLAISIPTRLAADEIDAGRIRVEDGISISANGIGGFVINNSGIMGYDNLGNVNIALYNNGITLNGMANTYAQIGGFAISATELTGGLTGIITGGTLRTNSTPTSAGIVIDNASSGQIRLYSNGINTVKLSSNPTDPALTVNYNYATNAGGYAVRCESAYSGNVAAGDTFYYFSTTLSGVSNGDVVNAQFVMNMTEPKATAMNIVALTAGVNRYNNAGDVVSSYGIRVYSAYDRAGTNNYGIRASATGALGGISYGVYGVASGASTNWAGYFEGNVKVTGTLTLPTGAHNTWVLTSDASGNASWAAPTGGGGGTTISGITTLNGLSSATQPTQTFAVGVAGTGFNIVSAGSTHTFNLPFASATASGLVNIGAQTFAGIKTFTSGVTLANNKPFTINKLDGSSRSIMYVYTDDELYWEINSDININTYGNNFILSTPLQMVSGGTGQNFSSVSAGSLPYFSAIGTMSTLASGVNGQVLTSISGLPVWGYTSFVERATQNLTSAGTTIVVTDGQSVTPITSNGNYTVTSVPTIAAGRDGQLAIVMNTGSNTITLQDMGTLGGSNLRLGATTRALSPLRGVLELVYDSTFGGWVEKSFTNVQTFTPSISTFTVDGSNALTAEVAAASTSYGIPTFAITYVGVPSTASINISASSGEIDPGDYPITLPSPYTSLTSGTTPPSKAVYRGASVATQTFTVSATVSGTPLTKTCTIQYRNRRYIGAQAQATALSSAQVLALAASDLISSQYGTFTVSTTTGEYIWFAHRNLITPAVAYMSVTGEIAGFSDMGTIAHTNALGYGPEDFRLYKTINTNFGSSNTVVTSSTRLTNRIYMGPSTATNPISTAEILALDDTSAGTSRLGTTLSASYTVTIAGSNYLWFCHPSGIVPDLANIIDQTTGFSVSGSYRNNISHTNDMGYTENYRCWRSDNFGIYTSPRVIVVS